MANEPIDPAPPSFKVAKELRVVKSGTGPARLYIDGEFFPYATAASFTPTAPLKANMPGVVVTIMAYRVEFINDMNRSGPPEANPDA